MKREDVNHSSNQQVHSYRRLASLVCVLNFTFSEGTMETNKLYMKSTIASERNLKRNNSNNENTITIRLKRKYLCMDWLILRID